MNLPNSHFTDFPIEFKEINPEDFPHFEVEDKTIISPDEQGYITSSLQENINLLEKNTLVINAAVGQGKTYSIIQIIKQYYEASEGYLVFVAAPYTSLVQQYCQKIKDAGIPQEQIYSYDYIGNEMHLDAWDSKIQVLTVNALLGNPGENDFINSQQKRNYLNYLVRKCEENNRKVVFIYDEIHDSYYNFKEEYIFNLWKWRNVIHKNILLSATYNESSKVVVKYLAELTDNKIKIIESERVRCSDNQSHLYLHFNPANHYKHDNDKIVSLVEELLNQGKNIDILSFGKVLADDICDKTDKGVGKVLLDAGVEIQKCTSELDDNQRPNREAPQNRYDPDKCNIGTNFKTGVSIEKENHAFIVILPPLGRKGKFKNKFGIFTDGINSVIQALARQRNSRDRTKGEIHIVLPPPDRFDIDSLPFSNEEQVQAFNNLYQVCQNYRSSDTDLVIYKPINSQDEILEEYYRNTLHSEISNEETFVKAIERDNKVRLEYPSYELFKLSKSEKYFSSKIKFFGKDLSSYVTYASITNQFVNCNLVDVNVRPAIYFKEGQVQFKLEDFYNDYLGEDFNESLFMSVTDSFKFYELRNRLFNDYRVFYKEENGSYDEVTSFSNKGFEKQFAAFFQRKFYPLNRVFANRYNRSGFYVDERFSRGEYLRSCISHARNMNGIGEESELIEAYISLDYFKSKLEVNVLEGSKKEVRIMYFPNQPMSNFINEEEYSRFDRMCELISENDIFIKRGVFDFKKAFTRTSEMSKKIKSLYNYIIEDFFETIPDHLYQEGSQMRIKKVNNVLEIPNPNFVIDLISEADNNFPESYWESESKKNELEEFINSSRNI